MTTRELPSVTVIVGEHGETDHRLGPREKKHLRVFGTTLIGKLPDDPAKKVALVIEDTYMPKSHAEDILRRTRGGVWLPLEAFAASMRKYRVPADKLTEEDEHTSIRRALCDYLPTDEFTLTQYRLADAAAIRSKEGNSDQQHQIIVYPEAGNAAVAVPEEARGQFFVTSANSLNLVKERMDRILRDAEGDGITPGRAATLIPVAFNIHAINRPRDHAIAQRVKKVSGFDEVAAVIVDAGTGHDGSFYDLPKNLQASAQLVYVDKAEGQAKYYRNPIHQAMFDRRDRPTAWEQWEEFMTKQEAEALVARVIIWKNASEEERAKRNAGQPAMSEQQVRRLVQEATAEFETDPDSVQRFNRAFMGFETRKTVIADVLRGKYKSSAQSATINLAKARGSDTSNMAGGVGETIYVTVAEGAWHVTSTEKDTSARPSRSDVYLVGRGGELYLGNEGSQKSNESSRDSRGL